MSIVTRTTHVTKRGCAVSVQDVTAFFCSIRSSGAFDIDSFTRVINLIRGRLFLVALNYQDSDYLQLDEDDFNAQLLNALLLPLVTSSLWRTVLNSHNFLKFQEKIRDKKNPEIFPHQSQISKLSYTKSDLDVKCVKKLEDCLDNFQQIIDLKDALPEIRCEILHSKARFIDDRKTFDHRVERKKEIYKKNIKFISRISLELIKHSMAQDPSSVGKQINKIKIRCCKNLNTFV